MRETEALEHVSQAKLPTELSAQGVERVEMDVDRNESQESHGPRRIPTPVLTSSVGWNILGHSQYRL